MDSKKLNCFLDGNALCVVKDDFVNVQESDSVFITLDPKQLEEIQKLESAHVELLRKEITEAHKQVKQNFDFSGGNPRFFKWKGKRNKLIKQLQEIDPGAEVFIKELVDET